MLLQDLHDSHVCNSLLVAESEEDIWKNESLYRQRLNTSDGKSEVDVDGLDIFLCNRRFNFFSDVTLSSFSHVFTYLCDLILVFLDPHIQITTQKRATRPEITWQPPCSLSLDILPVMWFGAQ